MIHVDTSINPQRSSELNFSSSKIRPSSAALLNPLAIHGGPLGIWHTLELVAHMKSRFQTKVNNKSVMWKYDSGPHFEKDNFVSFQSYRIGLGFLFAHLYQFCRSWKSWHWNEIIVQVELLDDKAIIWRFNDNDSFLSKLGGPGWSIRDMFWPGGSLNASAISPAADKPHGLAHQVDND